MAYPPITKALVAPNTAEPDTFNNDADQWAADIIIWTAEVNAAGAYVDEVAAQVDSDASDAADSEAAAAASAAAALVSETLAAASANFKGAWSAQTGAANKPYCVANNGAYWALLNNLADVTTSQPGVTSDWQFISGTRFQLQKTASFNAVPNAAYSVYATGAPVVATLQAMTDGYYVEIRNSLRSTQAVSIANAIFTIYAKNGLTLTTSDTITIEPGDMVRLLAFSSTILEVY